MAAKSVRLVGKLERLLMLASARFLMITSGLIVALCASAFVKAGELETEVKAAMIYKFLDYIEWPRTAFSSETSPYVIAVMGADDIAGELGRITDNRTVKERSIHVVQVDDLQGLVDSHVFFVGANTRVNHKRMEKLAEKHSVVTITENDEGLNAGSVINLRLVDGRVGFDVSLAATEKRNLKLSARMLAVASSVKKEPR